MAENEEQLIPFIKDLYAFRNLSEAELVKVAVLAEVVDLPTEEFVMTGEEQFSPFYMIITGKVRLEIRGKVGSGAILKKGEFFGADFLLYGKPRPTKAVALVPTQLLVLQNDKLSWLLTEIPGLKVGLKSVSDMTKWTHDRHFSWLGEDELVQLVVQKHPANLLVNLVVPVLIACAGIGLFIGAYYATVESFRLAMEYIGTLTLGVAVSFGVWKWVDWSNDYYVVTDQRVVWLEEIIGLYDSRQESPLTAIKSNMITASLAGRIFGYGDVIINAFMGRVIFRNTGNPNGVKMMIDQCTKTAIEHLQHSDRASMENLVRQKIDPALAPASSAQPDQEATKPAKKIKKPTRSLRTRLSNMFQTRWEEGDLITYRKHGYILLLKIGAPTVVELLFIALMILLIRDAAKSLIPVSLAVSTFLILLVSFIGVLLWWLYQYLDWHNDIFQISSDKLVDSIKRPLGSEVTKSAPLENVQSLDYQRKGILGVLLNFGSVFINVGTETKLIFKDIADPARAQQDIFNRMYDKSREKQLAEIVKQGEQITDWLAAYHHQAEELRKDQNKPQKE